ncbi:MAG: AAA family ATPase [Planctomycetes bacterium]|nr:AAA family ATPase [Planctomycetota bacterium]
MIAQLRFSAWKSFVDPKRSTLPFHATTLLVGPNASGKSNALDALQFLQGLAQDLTVEEVLRGRWEGGRQTWPGIRGGDAEAVWLGASEFQIDTDIHRDGALLRHEIRISTLPRVEVVAERLWRGETLLFDTNMLVAGRPWAQRDGTLLVGYEPSLPRAPHPAVRLRASRAVLVQLQSEPDMHESVLVGAQAVRDELRNLIRLDLQPHLMRSPAPVHASRMGAAGENIAAVLHGLSPRLRDDLVDWLSELCAPQIEGIHFVNVPEVREVYFQLAEGGRRVSSRSLSDGTLRFLGILVALLTAPAGTTIVIEEPDVGLHPSRVHLLAALLERLPNRHSFQVIASTHSPALLAHLSDEALANVLAFGRDPATGASVVARVGDLPAFPALRSSGQRDHLIATGWLERAL